MVSFCVSLTVLLVQFFPCHHSAGIRHQLEQDA